MDFLLLCEFMFHGYEYYHFKTFHKRLLQNIKAMLFKLEREFLKCYLKLTYKLNFKSCVIVDGTIYNQFSQMSTLAAVLYVNVYANLCHNYDTKSAQKYSKQINIF